MVLLRERCAVLTVGDGALDYRTLPRPAATAATAATATAAAQLPGGGGGVLAARARGRLYSDDAALAAALAGAGNQATT